MELLKEAILKKGTVLSGSILKVDSFLNHQVDVALMSEVGREFKRRFSDCNITKVLTVESSGIAPAVFTALELGVDAIFARKRKSLTLSEGLLSVDVLSYTKKEVVSVTISRNYLSKDDTVLIIDDFLANGEVCNGLIRLISQVGAEIAGIGIVIEKSFQKGRGSLDELGIRVESLARLASLDDGRISFIE